MEKYWENPGSDRKSSAGWKWESDDLPKGPSATAPPIQKWNASTERNGRERMGFKSFYQRKAMMRRKSEKEGGKNPFEEKRGRVTSSSRPAPTPSLLIYSLFPSKCVIMIVTLTSAHSQESFKADSIPNHFHSFLLQPFQSISTIRIGKKKI